jgi:hypothetical protein
VRLYRSLQLDVFVFYPLTLAASRQGDAGIQGILPSTPCSVEEDCSARGFCDSRQARSNALPRPRLGSPNSEIPLEAQAFQFLDTGKSHFQRYLSFLVQPVIDPLGSDPPA